MNYNSLCSSPSTKLLLGINYFGHIKETEIYNYRTPPMVDGIVTFLDKIEANGHWGGGQEKQEKG